MSDNNIGNDVPMHEPNPGKSAWDAFDGGDEESTTAQQPQKDAPAPAPETVAPSDEVPEVDSKEKDDGVFDPGPDLREFPANATVELPLFKDINEKQKKAITPAESINLLFATYRQIAHITANVKSLGGLPDPESSMDWVLAAGSAVNFMAPADEENVTYAAWQADRDWAQYLNHGADRLRAARPKIQESNAPKLSGQAAIRRVQARMSLGGHAQWPMYNSMFWVTFIPPQEAALLELDRRIQTEKIKLGRQTKGAVFDNDRIYIIKYVMDLILDHVDDTSLEYSSEEGKRQAIKDHLLITDIPSMILGFVSCIYPNGYPLSQPCTADLSKCHHVNRGVVDLNKLLFVDRKRFSEDQRRFMSKNRAGASMKLDDVKAMQSSFPVPASATIDLGNQMTMELRVPTYTEYEDSGLRWVDGIVEQTDAAFGSVLHGVDRDVYIQQLATVETLRNYSMYFGRIIIDAGEMSESVIDSVSTLEELSRTFSADREIVDLIVGTVDQFVEDATTTVIGIVNYACERCGETQLRPDAKEQIILPLDVVSTFFTLVSNRLQKILL